MVGIILSGFRVTVGRYSISIDCHTNSKVAAENCPRNEICDVITRDNSPSLISHELEIVNNTINNFQLHVTLQLLLKFDCN
jgi:hypothetical protein